MHRRPRLRRGDGLVRAIWSGVIGSASDMLGVWMAPVTAQLMMTLAMGRSPRGCWAEDCTAGAASNRGGKHPVHCLWSAGVVRVAQQDRAQDS